jgi:hypothetical protein
MMDEGVVSINYDTKTKAVSVVYEPDTPYDIAAVIAYVEDMTDGGSTHITIYEGGNMMHRMRKVKGEWNTAGSNPI